MFRKHTIAALATLATTAVQAQGTQLTEVTNCVFFTPSGTAAHLIMSFPRLDVDLFGWNRKNPNPWVDYAVTPLHLSHGDVTFGITASIQEARGTAGAWLAPSFRFGNFKWSGYGYLLVDDRGRLSEFVPNTRLVYLAGNANFGFELTGNGELASWKQRQGVTVGYTFTRHFSLRASALHGSGGNEFRLIADTRF